MGPGVWFDQRAGQRKVHIRLSHTTNNIPGWPDYEPGETDPNQLRLALCREEDYALFLTNCHHITFRDLELRFGNPDTIRLNTCTDIMFDHCRIRSGSRAIQLLTGNAENAWNEDITLEHCVIDGGIPTWFFRSDRKDEYLIGPTDKNRAPRRRRSGTGSAPRPAASRSPAPHATVGVIVHHCEIINAHDSYVFGEDMEFHHNWVHNLNDDGIALSGEAETSNAKIYCNVMTQCLTALSFAAAKTLGPGLPVWQPDRHPPTHARSPTQDSRQHRHRTRCGRATSSRTASTKGVIELFHNTCVVLDPGAKGDDLDDLTDAGFSYFVNIGANSKPRRAFNNILVAVYTADSHLRPIAFLAPPCSITQSDGNTYFRIPDGAEGSINFQVRRKIGDDGRRERRVRHPGRLPPGPMAPERGGRLRGAESARRPDVQVVRHRHRPTPTRRRPATSHSESPAKNNVAVMPQELRRHVPRSHRGRAHSTGAATRLTGRACRSASTAAGSFPFMRPPLGPPTHPDDLGRVAPAD